MCAYTQAEARWTHAHTHTPLLSGEIQTLLIPSAFVVPTKAGLQLFWPLEPDP